MAKHSFSNDLVDTSHTEDSSLTFKHMDLVLDNQLVQDKKGNTNLNLENFTVRSVNETTENGLSLYGLIYAVILYVVIFLILFYLPRIIKWVNTKYPFSLYASLSKYSNLLTVVRLFMMVNVGAIIAYFLVEIRLVVS